MEHLLLNFLLALVGTECVHNAVEIWGIRQKVIWLSLKINGNQHGKWPINIDTDMKAYMLHLGIFVISNSLFFGLLLMLHFSAFELVSLGIIALIINYALTTVSVHAYHLEIGLLLRKFHKNDK